MEILVTGGTGYIGSHTVVELLQAGHSVVIADNLCHSDRSVLDGIRAITGQIPVFYETDCCDRAALDRLFQRHPKLDAVIHFAALKAVNESEHLPLAYYANNLGALVTLLQAMQAHRVNQIVFSSSCTVYGTPGNPPVTEQSPIQPATSPYGATKQMCERILQDAVHADPSLSATALRYFNPIGAHESGLIGEKPQGVPQNLLPYVTETAAGIRRELRIFGNDYPTPDGTCIRDFIHVSDLARAHVCALEHMRHVPAGWRTYNIGTGRGTSVRELVDTFIRTTGASVPFRYEARRPGDIGQIWADPSLAERELGWKSVKTLEETLLSAWRWQQHITNLEK